MHCSAVRQPLRALLFHDALPACTGTARCQQLQTHVVGGPSRGDSLVSLATSSSVPSSSSSAAPLFVFCSAGLAPKDITLACVDCPAYSSSSVRDKSQHHSGMAVALGLHARLRIPLVSWPALHSTGTACGLLSLLVTLQQAEQLPKT